MSCSGRVAIVLATTFLWGSPAQADGPPHQGAAATLVFRAADVVIGAYQRPDRNPRRMAPSTMALSAQLDAGNPYLVPQPNGLGTRRAPGFPTTTFRLIPTTWDAKIILIPTHWDAQIMLLESGRRQGSIDRRSSGPSVDLSWLLRQANDPPLEPVRR